MKKIIYLIPLLIIFSCSIRKDENFKITNNNIINYDVLSSLPAKNISYSKKVRPILDKRCVVCHGCYDAPCQLKLTSIDGIRRGASKEIVYDGSRITAVPPTRLGVDHKSISEWRKNSFHEIISDNSDIDPNQNLENSLLYKFIQMKEIYPQPRSGLISYEIDTSLNRKQYCPTLSEFQNFERLHENLGMPFALPNLDYKEFYTLAHWVAQGSKGNDNKVEDSNTKRLIKKFETFLNNQSLKHRLIARYIYEHLFLGHISFTGDRKNNFYRLIRSPDKTGKPKENSAIRPYDDPKEKFYYRFKLYTSTIVAKNHTLYELSEKKLKRYKDLFIKPNYKVTKFPSYEPSLASNPFITYKEIPIRSKYKFLLDDSRFFIEGFIKGPVCRGQIALNVIEDRFWTFFVDPDSNGFSNNDELISRMNKYLDLPAGKESKFEFLSLWTKYWKHQRKYLTKRNENFLESKPVDIKDAMKFIWDGDKTNSNSALTIFRHLDSASVREGLIGTKPETIWILNYPIFERIHYLLVAGFNVYGNVSHQLKTRIYMDFLRMEGEEIFLSLLPPKERKELHTAWYGGNRNHLNYFQDEDLTWLRKEFVTGLTSDNKELEVLSYLKKRVRKSQSNNLMTFKTKLKDIEKLRGSFFRHFPEVIYVKLGNKAYSLVHNKEYKHVSFFLNDARERDSHDEENDTITLVKGIEGTYPNQFIELEEESIDQFLGDIKTISTLQDYQKFISKYAIRRTQPDFWEYSDWFIESYKKTQPKRAGILDLNRYQ
jgi:hypothetical protein